MTWGDSLAGNGDVALQHAGERRPDLGVADVSEHGADVDGRAVGEARHRLEHAGARADDEPLDREQVLNGIAYDAASDRLFITGKNWPQLFEIQVLD